MATIKRQGYGQLEPNHLSASYTGGVFAELPAAESIKVLEQGMFAKYSVAEGEVNFTGEGPWMLVYNEEKLYDERHQMHKDFALLPGDAYDKKMYPRLFTVMEGDLFTTNTVVEGAYTLGDKLKVDAATGRLTKGEAPAGEHSFKVVKETTMPDGQIAVQVQVLV